MRKKYIIIIIAIILAIIGVSVLFLFHSTGNDYQKSYRTQTIGRGDITQLVSATGTMNPVTLVTVGAQVSGRIQKLYVDYNSVVKKGQVLAEIDPTLLNATLKQSEGKLKDAKATLNLTEANFNRAKTLREKDFIAQSDLDKAEDDFLSGQANVQEQQAQVDYNKANLDYTIITSPVSGVIVSRSIDVGQTVTASLQTPTLFTIAEDLEKMQIITNVSEADVGDLKDGQKVNFTVDAYRDKQFFGTLTQIRLNPTTTQNVVTYSVVVDVDNSEKLLLPGMTAFVNIIISEKKNVLRTPNTALQFKPIINKLDIKRDLKQKGVYVLKNDKIQLVKVISGLNDNYYTEIVNDDLKEGDNVIIEEIANSTKSAFKIGR